MHIITGTLINQWVHFTIEHEPIRAIDLMERAATAITASILRRFGHDKTFVVMAGPGGNGSDALATARLLAAEGATVDAFLFNTTGELTPECATNARRLRDSGKVRKLVEVTKNFEPPQLTDATIVVDGLFGSGLNRPLQGGFAAVVKYVNQSKATVVSIDMPSGLMTEDNTENLRQHIMRADITLTLQQRKLAMYLADNQSCLGEVEVLDIKLSDEFLQRTPAQFHLTESSDITALLRHRHPYVHKGEMGHAMLFAGSYGMAGAVILAARAALRSGAGKVTVHSPLCNNDILQTAVPEAIIHHDIGDTAFMEMTDTSDYDAVAIGPGIGQKEETAIAMMSQIRATQCPLILDADALNILAGHRTWLSQLPPGLILTPHAGEFDRLMTSPTRGSYDRLARARELAEKLNAYIVLKGHHSILCCPDGDTIVNSTGNAGMATAGSGDILTGIIAALMARGYSQRAACLIGIYLHGRAGDIAAAAVGEESLIASDILKHLPQAFKEAYQPSTSL